MSLKGNKQVCKIRLYHSEIITVWPGMRFVKAYSTIFEVFSPRHVNIQVRGISTLPPMRAKAPRYPTSPNTHTHCYLYMMYTIQHTVFQIKPKTWSELMLRMLWQNLCICQSTINRIYLFIRHVRTVCCLRATRWLTLSCNRWHDIDASTFGGHQLCLQISIRCHNVI